MRAPGGLTADEAHVARLVVELNHQSQRIEMMRLAVEALQEENRLLRRVNEFLKRILAARR